MPQHVATDYGQAAQETFFDAVQEVLGTQAEVNLTLLNATTVRAVAGSGADQSGLGVGGALRWRTSNRDVSHPTGAAGTFDVWAVASALSITPGSPPTDTTDYSWDLAIVRQGDPQPGNAHKRKIGYTVWSGSAITKLVQTAGRRDDAPISPTSAVGSVSAVDAAMPAGATAAPIRATVGGSEVFAVSPTGALTSVGMTVTGTAGIVASGAGGKDTLALSSTGLDTGLTIGGDVTFYRGATGEGWMDQRLVVKRSATGDAALTTRFTADNAFQISAGGLLTWYEASNVPGATLGRTGASALTLSGSLTVTGALAAQGTGSFAGLSSSSGLTVSAGGAAITGTVNATAYQVGGVALAATHLSDGANVAHINATETVTQPWTFSGNLFATSGLNLTGTNGQNKISRDATNNGILIDTQTADAKWLFTDSGFAKFGNYTGGVQSTAATLNVLSRRADAAGVLIKGYASQSEPLLEFRNSGSTLLASVSAAGGVNAASYAVAGTALASSHLSDSAQIAHVNATETISNNWTFASQPTIDPGSGTTDAVLALVGRSSGAAAAAGQVRGSSAGDLLLNAVNGNIKIQAGGTDRVSVSPTGAQIKMAPTGIGVGTSAEMTLGTTALDLVAGALNVAAKDNSTAAQLSLRSRGASGFSGTAGYLQQDASATTGTLYMPGGATLNADTGGRHDFRVNNGVVLTINANGLGIGTAPVSGQAISTVTAGRAQFGEALIGQDPQHGATWASFRHTSMTTTGNYALMQNNSGDTLVNAATGRSLNLRINNADKIVINGTGIGFFSKTSNPAAQPAARTLTSWSSGANQVRSIDRTNWTFEQLFDFVMTMAYDHQQLGLFA
jgi:hypothetical protein